MAKKRAQLENGVLIYEDWQTAEDDGTVSLEQSLIIASGTNGVRLWDKDVDKLAELIRRVAPGGK